MPPKLCGRCNKTVYPTEELKCLDKSWHKGCFKCQVCNMTLNMKNYKGYDKLPYCNAHYPQTKHTAVADTPESRRIAENTKIQSNIEYRREFEESKSRYYQVTDTPEMKTNLRNTQNISMIKYHAEYEKQKGKKITVADDPETQRVRHNMDVISNVSYHGDRERRNQMEMARPAEQVEGEDDDGRVRPNPGRIADYDPTEVGFGSGGGTPYSNRNSAGAKQVYDSNIGRDEDPGEYNNQERRTSRGSVKNRVQRFSSSGDEDPARLEQPQSRKVGSISDYDPLNEKYGSIAGQHTDPRRAQQPAQQYQPPPQQPYQPPPQQYQQPPAEPQQPRDDMAGKGMVCKAMYDYDAADADEVGFREGDLIVFCQPIDAGWMEGTVESTGKRGMLPSNYVEKIN
ncbi:LIM and SH3 domain protein 1-like isoform X4 [Ruditapes philippinarum]|uniref:LIM and SH3 domain protein 1-like isoform X4 n=1 Tax=Ruditapes philippinarum TaxID=129788 RepID=UPI00295AF58D|nr:LIM and SH3 domain protein 1-like isoform X4 [Ruditapes philippinarum]